MKVMLFNLVLTPQHSTISFKVQKHTVLSAVEYLRPFQLILIAWLPPLNQIPSFIVDFR